MTSATVLLGMFAIPVTAASHPAPPSGEISVITYDGHADDPADATDGAKQALDPTIDADDEGHAATYLIQPGASDSGPQPVRWVVTNTGTAPLYSVGVEDITSEGPPPQNVTCLFPGETEPAEGVQAQDSGNAWTIEWRASTEVNDGIAAAVFEPGDTFYCEGEVTLGPGEIHKNTVRAAGKVVDPVTHEVTDEWVQEGSDPFVATTSAPDEELTGVKIENGLLSAEPVGDGRWAVSYQITVVNTGDEPGSYDLDDEFGFSPAVSVVSVDPVMADPPKVTINPGFDGSRDTRIVTGQEIPAPDDPGYTDHVYTVSAVVEVPPSISSIADDVDQAMCSDVEGVNEYEQALNNVSALTAGGRTQRDDACAPLPSIEITKEAVDLKIGDDGFATISYDVTVTNDGGAAGEYDLYDQLRYGLGISVVSSKVVTAAPGGVVVEGTWTGLGAVERSEKNMIASGVAIDADSTHSYRVEVAFEVDGDNPPAESGLECPPELSDGDRGGLLGGAIVVHNDIDRGDRACESLEPLIEPAPMPTPTAAPTTEPTSTSAAAPTNEPTTESTSAPATEPTSALETEPTIGPPSASALVADPPGPTLPSTGSQVTLYAGIAVLLLGTGALLVVARRRAAADVHRLNDTE